LKNVIKINYSAVLLCISFELL